MSEYDARRVESAVRRLTGNGKVYVQVDLQSWLDDDEKDWPEQAKD